VRLERLLRHMSTDSFPPAPELQLPPPPPPEGYLVAPGLGQPPALAPAPDRPHPPSRLLRRLLLVPIIAIAVYTLYSYFLSADAHYRRAEKAWDAYRYDLAAKEAQAALTLSPRMGKAHHMLGIALLSLGQPWAAVEPLGRAVELQPEEAEWHTDLGIAYQTTGRMSAAIAEHKRCIALDPSRADGHHNLAMCYSDAGLYAAAEKEFKAAIARDPNDGQAHVHYGMMLEDAGKRDQARALYKQALALPQSSRHYIGGPTNPVGSASLRLGALYLEDDQPREALQYFNRAVQFYAGHDVPALVAAQRGRAEALRELQGAPRPEAPPERPQPYGTPEREPQTPRKGAVTL